jgi:hypothetical protein
VIKDSIFIIRCDFFPNLGGDADMQIEPYPTLNSFLASNKSSEDADIISKS